MRAALHAHGCTALCLSGGGAIALYHLGVVKELHERGLLPRVISGTSGGSIVAAMLACHTDAELPRYVRPYHSIVLLLSNVLSISSSPCSTYVGSLPLLSRLRFFVETVAEGASWLDPAQTMFRRLISQGVALNADTFLEAIRGVCADYTFAEAHARTGRVVSISTSTPFSTKGSATLLNHVNAPNVLIRSAVQASCALPGVMRPAKLLAKAADGAIFAPHEAAGLRFRDGSFQSDIPLAALAAQFSATHFIVSQVSLPPTAPSTPTRCVA